AEAFDGQGPLCRTSAYSGMGTEPVAHQLMEYVEAIWEAEAENPELKEQENELQNQMAAEARERIDELREMRRQARLAAGEDDDDFNDDDYDVEVIYVNY